MICYLVRGSHSRYAWGIMPLIKDGEFLLWKRKFFLRLRHVIRAIDWVKFSVSPTHASFRTLIHNLRHLWQRRAQGSWCPSYTPRLRGHYVLGKALWFDADMMRTDITRILEESVIHRPKEACQSLAVGCRFALLHTAPSFECKPRTRSEIELLMLY